MNFSRLWLQIIGLSMLPALAHPALYTGGLHFMRSPELIVQRQDINLSVDQVTVSYMLNNTSNSDITETLVFPQPVAVTVNDQHVNFHVTQRAISNTGKDVSNILRSLGVPFDPITAMHTIDASPNRDSIRDKLIALKLIDIKDENAEWFTKSFYYWQQKFPANTTTSLKQTYKPSVISKNVKIKANASIINFPVHVLKKIWNLTVHWSLEEKITAARLQAQLEKDNPHMQAFCPTLKDYQAIIGPLNRIENDKSSVETKELNYDYIADDIWATPVNKFTLRIITPEDMHPMLCWSGEMQRHARNTLVFEADNFVPQQNLSVLFVEK